MPDIHDMELDARITEAEMCEHKDKTYQPYEYDTNIGESYTCDDCGKEFDTLKGATFHENFHCKKNLINEQRIQRKKF